MNTEEQDDLWQLLGKAKQPAVSPFFARNVLRQIRETKPTNVFAWLGRKWRFATLGAVAAMLLAVNSSQFFQPSDPDVALLAQQVSSKSDYEVINNLDELLASEESSIWLDNPSQ